MASKDQKNEDVYQFPDQEDKVEYKPKGLVLDVVSDMVGNSALSKYITVRSIILSVFVIALIMVIMNFRLVLSWAHLGLNKAQSIPKVTEKAVPKKAVKSMKKTLPTSVAKKQTSQSSKEAALKLIAQTVPAKPIEQAPLLPVSPPVSKPPKVSPVPINKAEVLLKQVQVLDQPPLKKSSPEPVAPIAGHQQALANNIKQLGQKLEAMEKSQSQMEDNLERMVRQLKEVQASVKGLKKSSKKAEAHPVKKAAVAVAKKVQPVDHSPHYRVQAMVYGRVWLQRKDTQEVISLRVGDPIPGLKGRVKNIYLNDFFVETTEGKHIYDRFQ